MHRVLRLIAREYTTMVRTKGFIIGLIIMPVVMTGSIIAMKLIGDGTDTADQKVAIVDRSGVVADRIIELAEERNALAVYDSISGDKVKPAYLFEIVPPDDTDPAAQRLELKQGPQGRVLRISRDRQMLLW